MKPIGKTYLIDAELPKEQKTKQGIILPVLDSSRSYESYIGYIKEYGIGFNQEQKKNLIPLGTKVIFNYNKGIKSTKVFMDNKTYYIYNPQDILAIIEED